MASADERLPLDYTPDWMALGIVSAGISSAINRSARQVTIRFPSITAGARFLVSLRPCHRFRPDLRSSFMRWGLRMQTRRWAVR